MDINMHNQSDPMIKWFYPMFNDSILSYMCVFFFFFLRSRLWWNKQSKGTTTQKKNYELFHGMNERINTVKWHEHYHQEGLP